jgi:hypothetical protein
MAGNQQRKGIGGQGLANGAGRLFIAGQIGNLVIAADHAKGNEPDDL